MPIQQVPLRFIQTGFGNGVCANQILAVLVPDSAPNKRLLTQARKDQRFLDMTCGRGVRSMLLMLDGQVVGCAMSPRTMLLRLNAPDYDEAATETTKEGT